MAPLPAPAEKPSHRVSDSQSHAKVRPPTQVAVFCAALWPNLQPALTHEMPPSSDIVAPVGAEHNTLYVAIEISRKSWVIGIKSPASERIGLHSLGAADVVGLKDLIEHQHVVRRVGCAPIGAISY